MTTPHARAARALARLFALTSLALALPAAAQAQIARPLLSLRVGDTVRVWTSNPAEQVGVVTTLERDTLGLRRGDGRALTIPLASLSHLDVQRGRRTSAVAVIGGILLGGAAGALAGSFGGAALECLRGCDGEFGGLAGFVIGGAVGTIVGAGSGGIIAGRKFRSRKWEQLHP